MMPSARIPPAPTMAVLTPVVVAAMALRSAMESGNGKAAHASFAHLCAALDALDDFLKADA